MISGEEWILQIDIYHYSVLSSLLLLPAFKFRKLFSLITILIVRHLLRNTSQQWLLLCCAIVSLASLQNMFQLSRSLHQVHQV
jgi:hypothetical protein